MGHDLVAGLTLNLCIENFEAAMDGKLEALEDGVALMEDDSGRSMTLGRNQALPRATCHVSARFADAEAQRQHQSFVLGDCLGRLQHASHEASADNLRYVLSISRSLSWACAAGLEDICGADCRVCVPSTPHSVQPQGGNHSSSVLASPLVCPMWAVPRARRVRRRGESSAESDESEA